jgi:hypothetical protein
MAAMDTKPLLREEASPAQAYLGFLLPILPNRDRNSLNCGRWRGQKASAEARRNPSVLWQRDAVEVAAGVLAAVGVDGWA